MDKDASRLVYSATDYLKGSIKESYDEGGNNYCPAGLMDQEDVCGAGNYGSDRREKSQLEDRSEYSKQRTGAWKTMDDGEWETYSPIRLFGQGASTTILGVDVAVGPTASELESGSPASSELERRPLASELDRRSDASELESMPKASDLGKRSAASELDREEIMSLRERSIVLVHEKCDSAVSSCASEHQRPPAPKALYPNSNRDRTIFDSNTLNSRSNTLCLCHTALESPSRLYSISEQNEHSTTETGANPTSFFGHQGLLDYEKDDDSHFRLRRRGGIDEDDDDEDEIDKDVTGDDSVFTYHGPQSQETTDGQDDGNEGSVKLDGEPSGSVSALFQKAAAIRQMIRDAEKEFSDQFICTQSLDDSVDVQLKEENFSRSRTSSRNDQDYSPSLEELSLNELDLDVLKQAGHAEEYGGRSGNLLTAEVGSASCKGIYPGSLKAADIAGHCLQTAVRFPVCSELGALRGIAADSAFRLESVLRCVSPKSTTITHLRSESVSQAVSRKGSISRDNAIKILFCHSDQGISVEGKRQITLSNNRAYLATNVSNAGTMTFGITASHDASVASGGQILIAKDCFEGSKELCRSEGRTIVEVASDECADDRPDKPDSVETAGDKYSPQAGLGTQEEYGRNQHAGTNPDSQSEPSSENITRNDKEFSVEGIEQGQKFEAAYEGEGSFPNPGGAFPEYDTLSDVLDLEFDFSDEAEPQVCDRSGDGNDCAATKTPERECIAPALKPLSRSQVVGNATEESSIIDISNSDTSMSGYIASSEPEIASITEVCEPDTTDSTSVVSWEEDEDEDGRGEGGGEEQDDDDDNDDKDKRGGKREEEEEEEEEVFGEKEGIKKEVDRSIHDEKSSAEPEEEQECEEVDDEDTQSRREENSSADVIQTEETATDAIDEPNDQDHPLSSLNDSSEVTELSSGSSPLEDISYKSIAGSANNTVSCLSTFDQYSPRNDGLGSQMDSSFTSVFEERSENNAWSNSNESENSCPSIFEERSINNGSSRSADFEDSGSSICAEQSFYNGSPTFITACSDDSCPSLVGVERSDVSCQTLFETYNSHDGLPDLISTSLGTPTTMSGDDEQPGSDHNDQGDSDDEGGYTAAAKKRHYVCEVCGTFYSRRENMEGHLLQHALRPWSKTDCSCRGCGANFHAIPSLKEHMRRNRERVGFMCPRCDAWFPVCDDLLRHLQPPCPALYDHRGLYLDRYPLITGRQNAVPRLWLDTWSSQ